MRLFVVFVLACALFSLTSSECFGNVAKWLHAPRTALRIQNLQLTVYPKLPDGSIMHEANASVDVLGFQQLGVWNRICKEPTTGFPVTSNTTDAHIYRTIDFKDVECSFEEEVFMLSDGITEINQTTISITHPSWPGLLIYLNISIPSRDAQEILYHDPLSNITYYSNHRYCFSVFLVFFFFFLALYESEPHTYLNQKKKN
jgi:hypothetical protein